MPWATVLVPEFLEWLDSQDLIFQEKIMSYIDYLSKRGPSLGRPKVDTLKGSSLPNLKEMRISYKGAPFRILFVFDMERNAVFLFGGNKQGDPHWYENSMRIAEIRFEEYLRKL